VRGRGEEGRRRGEEEKMEGEERRERASEEGGKERRGWRKKEREKKRKEKGKGERRKTEENNHTCPASEHDRSGYLPFAKLVEASSPRTTMVNSASSNAPTTPMYTGCRTKHRK
jgi:hypothetical protein